MADSKENYKWDLGSWRINYRNLWHSWSVFKIQPFLLLFSCTIYLLICYWKRKQFEKSTNSWKNFNWVLWKARCFKIKPRENVKMLELACVQPLLYPKQHHKGILSQFFCVFVFSTCRDRLSTKALTLVWRNKFEAFYVSPYMYLQSFEFLICVKLSLFHDYVDCSLYELFLTE